MELTAARAERAPLSHLEVLAWAMLTERTPSPFELSALRSIDRCFLHVTSGKLEASMPDDGDVAAQVRDGLRAMMKDQKAFRAKGGA